jgi:hypothetical protein
MSADEKKSADPGLSAAERKALRSREPKRRSPIMKRRRMRLLKIANA